MITATAWVPRGYSAPFPKRYVLDEEEYGRIAKLAKLELEDAKEDLEEAQAGANGTKTDTNGAKEDITEDADADKDEDGDVYVERL